MSGTVIVAILLTLAPFFFPVIMQLLGLITGTIQAYIFAILATVYIASATAAQQGVSDAGTEKTENSQTSHQDKGESHGES